MEHKTAENEQPMTLTRKPFTLLQKGTAIVLVLIVAAIIVVGLIVRRGSETALAKTTERAAVLAVNTIAVQPTQQSGEIILPGNTQPFVDAAIYARTSGYLKKWYVDIGGHVKQGQLLVDIETPELDRQVEQARADLQTSQEAERLARTTNDRWQKLLKDDAVSQQETDQYASDLQAKRSALDAATANVHRLEQLQSFEKVYAPFSGVITARNTDVGALIDAGAGAAPKELFHISDVSKLRVYVSVPEAELESARNGASVDLTLDEYPGRKFTGTIVRSTDAIDPATRTMRIEIDLNNSKDEVKTGAFIRAHFKPSSKLAGDKGGILTIPANTLLFRTEGLRVAVVQNGKAVLAPLTVGRDFGSSLEILSGVKPGDHIIVNPPDSIITGTAVKDAAEAGEPGK